MNEIFGTVEIRTIRASVGEVAEEILGYFESKDFTIEETETFDNEVIITAQNSATSFWTLLKRGDPQVVLVKLLTVDENNTQIELGFKATKDFRIRLYTTFCGALGIILATVWAWKHPGMANYIRTDYWIGFPIILTVSCAGLCWYLFEQLRISGSFFRDLFGRLHVNLGHQPKIIRPMLHSEERLICILLWFIFFGLMLWQQWTLHAHRLIFSVAVDIALALLITLGVFAANFALGRHVQTCLIFATSVVVIIYGIIPLIVSLFYGLEIQWLQKVTESKGPQVGLFALFTSGTLIFIVLVFLAIGFQLAPLTVRLVAAVDYFRAHPELMMTQRRRQSIMSASVVVLLWILSSVGHLLCVVINLSLMEFCVLGRNTILPFKVTSDIGSRFAFVLHYCFQRSWLAEHSMTMARYLIFLYCLPLTTWILLMLVRNLAKVRPLRHSTREPVGDIEPVIQSISAYANISAPTLRVLSGNTLEAAVEIPMFPGWRPCIVISTGTIHRLSAIQLEAIIAHEVGHIKLRHVFMFSLGNFLSRWTFMGEGFLAAWMRESYRLELEADRFAVEWLENGRKTAESRAAFIDALRVIEKERIVQVLQASAGDLSQLGATSHDWLDPKLREEIPMHYSKGLWAKIRIVTKLGKLFYFQSWQATYIYLPFSKRIEYIWSVTPLGRNTYEGNIDYTRACPPTR